MQRMADLEGAIGMLQDEHAGKANRCSLDPNT
jgi:hypothetical protein